MTDVCMMYMPGASDALGQIMTIVTYDVIGSISCRFLCFLYSALNVIAVEALGKRVRDAAFFFIIMLVTFAATLLNPQKYVSSRTIQKCVEHVSTST